MAKKMIGAIVAGIAWGTAFCDLIPGVPMSEQDFMLALSVAICATAFVMMNCYQRPLGDAYELGYEMGRRAALLQANDLDVSPIRRVPNGLGGFNIEALKAKPIRRRQPAGI